ncbi:acyl carrier protein [Anaerocolumna sp. AGMB13025]|uniref:acyl carrier protein n=1 Tax=Anaerocolumna sp. AGMB13025 TaxID=3039116 RepID=UPI00241DCA6B|nr:acyl carrier protein [Anaerocolumna sp. AGMB13025]WFR57124.1 acyl carrier protein [Anaerocolumna sp. AGMB13025]
MKSIKERVVKVLLNNKVSDKVLESDISFTDLGINSLAFIKILIDLELEFDCEFQEEDLLYESYVGLESLCQRVDTILENK